MAAQLIATSGPSFLVLATCKVLAISSFPRSAFTFDIDIRIGSGRLCDLGQKILHGLAFSNDVFKPQMAFNQILEPFHLIGEPLLFKGNCGFAAKADGNRKVW